MPEGDRTPQEQDDLDKHREQQRAASQRYRDALYAIRDKPPEQRTVDEQTRLDRWREQLSKHVAARPVYKEFSSEIRNRMRARKTAAAQRARRQRERDEGKIRSAAEAADANRDRVRRSAAKRRAAEKGQPISDEKRRRKNEQARKDHARRRDRERRVRDAPIGVEQHRANLDYLKIVGAHIPRGPQGGQKRVAIWRVRIDDLATAACEKEIAAEERAEADWLDKLGKAQPREGPQPRRRPKKS